MKVEASGTARGLNQSSWMGVGFQAVPVSQRTRATRPKPTKTTS